MKPWAIPTVYTIVSLLAALVLPRLEHHFLPGSTHAMSAAAAIAFLSATASGIIAFTAIVFSVAFVMVQFSAVAYSPRLVVWFAGRHELHHALGIFVATFTYAMATLLWTDRGGSGEVPALSTLLVLVLLVASLLVFSRLVQNLAKIQITEVLVLVGDEGRRVIDAQAHLFDACTIAWAGDDQAETYRLATPVETIVHRGPPGCVTSIDFRALVSRAEAAGTVVELAIAVGDTLVEGDAVLRVAATASPLPADDWLRCIHTGRERTFEQDPKYALRLLVDIAIKALSPAINDPTTAVQALDQIDDLLRRLSPQPLGNLWIKDGAGIARLFVPMPVWEDYLALAFDEIRQYGLTSVQVMRRLHAALAGLAGSDDTTRRIAVRRYLSHLDTAIRHSGLDPQDRTAAREEDPQGLGFARSERMDDPTAAQRK
ncbi:DUF2254 domain-containing protein [Microvirga sp. Mcv34]|uniref:DUF2254 domain-containing protein n=1 Tax=Microvirga sp. Mcv34 TaxID=2926016 RepID=UPI0021C5A02D|nr:DUF2254 domain-containing protein [Microvirga sp. Mcv34]